jgi:hypothetical protein
VAEGRRSRGERQQQWSFNGACYRRWKQGREGDGVRLFLEGKRWRRRGGFTVLEADNTVKSDMAAGEAESGDGCLEVEDDQRKLGRWTECAIGSNC